MNYIIFCDIPNDTWEVILVTSSIYSVIDKIKNTKANFIQIWENEKLIGDFNFTKEWECNTIHEYEIILKDELFRFMKLIDKINNKKQNYIELKHAKEKLNKEGRKLRIGIALKPKKDEDIITKFINIVNVHKGNEKIIQSKISRDSAMIETESGIYQLMKPESDARGTRFHKVLYDEIPNETLDKLIRPLTTLGERMGIHNTVEKISFDIQ